MSRIYDVLRALSLDIVLGGLAGGALAVSVTGARMPAAWWLILAGAIWVVYTADHLLDARRIGPAIAGIRHGLHPRHPVPIAAAAGAVALLCALASWLFLPRVVVLGGMTLFAAGVLHLAAAQHEKRRWLPKELFVAAIYTAGIWFAPILLARVRSGWVLAIAGLHLVAVLLNMAMYAIFEERIDIEEDSASLSRLVGARPLRRGLAALTAAAMAGAAAGMALGPVSLRTAWAALLLPIAAPAVFLALPSFFGVRLRYRLYGEMVFLLLALPYWIR